MTEGADSALPPADAAGLMLRDFDGLIGTVFVIQTELGAQELVLGQAQEVPGSLRPEGGFRLEFNGPSQLYLPQATYVFPVGDAAHEIFIVPIGPGQDQRLRYEAIFF